MPPRVCLHTLPIRFRDSTTLHSPLLDARWLAQSSPFSTTSRTALPMPAKKKQSMEGPPQKGTRALRIKKKGRPAVSAKAPEPGERKAHRKRIVLSNTNALEVSDLQDLSRSNFADSAISGRVLGLPDPVVDALRAVEAFKVGQGWGFFRRPACLIREESVHLARIMEEIERSPLENDDRIAGTGIKEYTGQTLRRLIVGERGVGKSVILLQAMAIAFLRGWVVVNFPEGRDLTFGHTAYSPIPNTNPVQYLQQAYTAKLLSQIMKANKPVLSKLSITQSHKAVPTPIQSNISLDRFAELGVVNPDIAWPIFQGLWKELTAPNAGRPPIFLGLDNISRVLTDSKYTVIDAAGRLDPIHAHDLVLVKHFLNYFSGKETLPNGGVVMAATSQSDHVRSPALDVSIAMTETLQTLLAEKRALQLESPTSYSEEPTLTTEERAQELNIAKFYSPYKKLCQRSMDVLQDMEVVRLQGLSKEQARAIMEYWAASGMVRKSIEEKFVAEKWTLAGQGVVGELEKTVVRSGRL